MAPKTYTAAMKYKVKQLIVAGGVAANRSLRASIESKFTNTSIPVYIPPIQLCTDNAAMIAAAAAILYEKEHFSSLDLNANPGLSLV